MAQKIKKGHAGLIIFIIVLILAIGGGAGFYFYQRQQPQKAAEKFLDSMKNMDFSTMESMLQSSDLSCTGQCRYPQRCLYRFLYSDQSENDL